MQEQVRASITIGLKFWDSLLVKKLVPSLTRLFYKLETATRPRSPATHSTNGPLKSAASRFTPRVYVARAS